MGNYMVVKLGGTSISNNAVTVEVGKSIYPAQNILQNMTVGSIIELNQKVSLPLAVFVNDQFVAKAQAVISQGSAAIKILEIIDESRNISIFTKNEIIALDTNKSAGGVFICDAFVNNSLVANGKLVTVGENFALCIERIVSNGQ